jgi:hypothetical protein
MGANDQGDVGHWHDWHPLAWAAQRWGQLENSMRIAQQSTELIPKQAETGGDEAFRGNNL